ncbi:MAG: aldo/keto reductase [Chlamydiales bacterium]
MECTEIPNLKMKASRVGLGTWAMGGWLWGGTDEKNSIKTIRHALDLGVNLIDTAPAYGFGFSEEIVGKAIKQHGKRDRIIISTKVGLSWKGESIFRDARKKVILEEVEASLERLQMDYHLGRKTRPFMGGI